MNIREALKAHNHALGVIGAGINYEQQEHYGARLTEAVCIVGQVLALQTILFHDSCADRQAKTKEEA